MMSSQFCSRAVFMWPFSPFFSPSPLDPIRLTLRLNVGTWETLPSVTLQMALRVKVGHGETLSSTRCGTMEITGV